MDENRISGTAKNLGGKIEEASSRSRVGDFSQFRSTVCCVERCGHVGNALALSIMSTVMLRAHAMDWSTRLC